MKKIALMIAGLGIAVTAIPAASAQGAWQNINQRQAQLERRIDRGVRNGYLSRREAVALRGEFRRIEALESRYRRSAPGLTRWERRDLDRRFDSLSARIRSEGSDRDNRSGRR